MEAKSRNEIIAYYLQQLEEKDIEISQIRRELEQKGTDNDEIKIIIRAIDAELQQRLTSQDQSKNANTLIWTGLFLMAVGVAITVLSYKGVIDTGNRDILSYGPFVGGLALFFIGRSKKLKRSS